MVARCPRPGDSRKAPHSARFVQDVRFHPTGGALFVQEGRNDAGAWLRGGSWRWDTRGPRSAGRERRADVAQLAEQPPRKWQVVGSNPTVGSKWTAGAVG